VRQRREEAEVRKKQTQIWICGEDRGCKRGSRKLPRLTSCVRPSLSPFVFDDIALALRPPSPSVLPRPPSSLALRRPRPSSPFALRRLSPLPKNITSWWTLSSTTWRFMSKATEGAKLSRRQRTWITSGLPLLQCVLYIIAHAFNLAPR
jgi:hypothetical protein